MVSAQAQAQTQPNWYIKSLGGVIASTDQLEQGKVSGTAKVEFVRLVYKNKIGIGGSYWDINNAGSNWEDYAGKLYFFARNPKLEKFYPYIFLASAMTHQEGSEKKLGEFTYDGGFGLIVPIGDLDVVTEFGAKRMTNWWLLSVVAGLEMGLDF